MTVKERLKKFIDYKKISIRAFEQQCNLSLGYVNNIRVSIQPGKITSIASRYPELNTGWLLTGEGDMLKSPTLKKIENDSSETITIHRDVLDIIKKQADSLEKRDSQIDKLIGILKDQLHSKKVNVHTDDNAECADASGSGLVK